MSDGLAGDLIFFFLNPPPASEPSWWVEAIVGVITGTIIAGLAGWFTAVKGLAIWHKKRDRERIEEVKRESRAKKDREALEAQQFEKRQKQLRDAVFGELVQVYVSMGSVSDERSNQVPLPNLLAHARGNALFFVAEWARSQPELFYSLPEAVLISHVWTTLKGAIEQMLQEQEVESFLRIGSFCREYTEDIFKEVTESFPQFRTALEAHNQKALDSIVSRAKKRILPDTRQTQ